MGPYDAIPGGKKAVLVNGKWELVDLDAKIQEDAVILLAEAKEKCSALEKQNLQQAEIIKQQMSEIERLKIAAVERGVDPPVPRKK